MGDRHRARGHRLQLLSLPGAPRRPGPLRARDPRLTEESVEALRERFGLDKPQFLDLDGGNPFDTQFFAYFGALASGDLGVSYAFQDQSVADLLGQALVNTIWLVLPAELIAIFLGILLGLLAAWRRGTKLDVGALGFSLFMWSLPTFFLGIVLLYVGSRWLGLPVAGRVTIGGSFTDLWDPDLGCGQPPVSADADPDPGAGR